LQPTSAASSTSYTSSLLPGSYSILYVAVSRIRDLPVDLDLVFHVRVDPDSDFHKFTSNVCSVQYHLEFVTRYVTYLTFTTSIAILLS
jgi:hypothetical protein